MKKRTKANRAIMTTNKQPWEMVLDSPGGSLVLWLIADTDPGVMSLAVPGAGDLRRVRHDWLCDRLHAAALDCDLFRIANTVAGHRLARRLASELPEAGGYHSHRIKEALRRAFGWRTADLLEREAFGDPGSSTGLPKEAPWGRQFSRPPAGENNEMHLRKSKEVRT